MGATNNREVEILPWRGARSARDARADQVLAVETDKDGDPFSTAPLHPPFKGDQPKLTYFAVQNQLLSLISAEPLHEGPQPTRT